MKKLLALLLSFALLASLGTAAFAEEDDLVFDVPECGIRVAIPGEFKTPIGYLDMSGAGELEYGSDVYFSGWRYLGMT